VDGSFGVVHVAVVEWEIKREREGGGSYVVGLKDL
jgi:hypothetical protein